MTAPSLDIDRIRADFPILSREVHGKPLVYLDTGASAQTPSQVVDAMRRVYEESYSNVHRGVHALSQEATDQFEAARRTVAGFINAPSEDEVIFTRGATEAINLVAHSYAGELLEPGDEIVISELEHHSNIVPWQLVAKRTGLVIKAVPMTDEGGFDLEAYAALLGPRTRIVALAHIANSIGTLLPVAEITRLAHEAGAVVLLDGCQAVPHMGVDVAALGVDFYAFSGHKLYGPTGVGVLWGKMEHLQRMPPYQGGGEMIDEVTLTGSTFKDPPHRFEAGTPAIVEVIGLGAAVDWVNGIGIDAIQAHEADLLAYALQRLGQQPDVRLFGPADVRERAAIVSFLMDGVHSHDIGTILDRAGIAVRAGQHCAQPVMDRFGVHGTARASFGVYNTRAEIDRLVAGLDDVRSIFG